MGWRSACRRAASFVRQAVDEPWFNHVYVRVWKFNLDAGPAISQLDFHDGTLRAGY